MERQRIDMFLLTQGKYFPQDKLPLIQNRLETLSDDKFALLQASEWKDPTLFLVLGLFLGHWGVDRFMLGQVGLGLGKLFTFGGCGIWTVIDWFLIMDAAKQHNVQQFMNRTL